ncbi:MAG: DsbA family protein [Geminicoccaceae bacterium]
MTLRLSARARLPLLLGAGLLAAGALPVPAVAADEVALGDPAAPVTMIEYASLTCPHCAAFHKELLPGIKERWIDTGKVRYVFRDFPLDGVALKAAVLAHCAGPDRYYAFLDALFSSQTTWARAKDPVAAIKQLARLGGLSEEKADACLADEAMSNAVLQSRLDGEKEFKVDSTPTIIINGTVYEGDRTLDAFAAVIDPLTQ